MKSHARLHKTLASLAVAMTGTAVFLNWMDPGGQVVMAQFSPEQIESVSRELVGGAAPIRPGRWRAVEITTDDHISWNNLALAASPDQRECHFFIDAAGRPSRETQWSRQKFWPESPNTVRIHVQRTQAGNEIANPVQWLTVRALIHALDQALGTKGTIPIQLRSDDTGLAHIGYSSSL